MNKFCVLVGGGVSIREGINNDLWNKLKGTSVWSLNFAYKTMPYAPTRELFADVSFFNNNSLALPELAKRGTEIIAKAHSRYNTIKEIKQYYITRNKNEYLGDEALEKKLLYIGRMGLTGLFALSLAVAEKWENIILLGFDFGPTNHTNHLTHYYQDKINVISSGVGDPHVYYKNDGTIKNEVEDFSVYLTKNNSKIYNVGLASNIPYFDKIDYPRFFELIEELKSNAK